MPESLYFPLFFQLTPQHPCRASLWCQGIMAPPARGKSTQQPAQGSAVSSSPGPHHYPGPRAPARVIRPPPGSESTYAGSVGWRWHVSHLPLGQTLGRRAHGIRDSCELGAGRCLQGRAPAALQRPRFPRRPSQQTRARRSRLCARHGDRKRAGGAEVCRSALRERLTHTPARESLGNVQREGSQIKWFP